MKKTKLFSKMLILVAVLYSQVGWTQQTQDQSQKNRAANEKLIRYYYTAYEKKDWSMMEPILADGFTFTSPNGDDHINLKLYRERCWPNAKNIKKFDLEKVVIDGDDAYVTYNGSTTSGKLFRNTERFKFKEGKITENECFFGAGVNFPNSGK
jgi:ketosteroid isomerase-like protein